MDGLQPRRYALKVVQGEQDIRRQAKIAQRLARQFSHGLDFQVAPGTARLARLVQPIKLGSNPSAELAPSLAATAGREEGCIAWPVPFHPKQHAGTFGIAA